MTPQPRLPSAIRPQGRTVRTSNTLPLWIDEPRTAEPDLPSYDLILINSSAGKDSQTALDVTVERARSLASSLGWSSRTLTSATTNGLARPSWPPSTPLTTDFGRSDQPAQCRWRGRNNPSSTAAPAPTSWTARTAAGSSCPAPTCSTGAASRNSGTRLPNAPPTTPPPTTCTKSSNPPPRPSPGLEKALAALGLLDDALALDLRRPQDYFHRVWNIGFLTTDLKTVTAELESTTEQDAR